MKAFVGAVGALSVAVAGLAAGSAQSADTLGFSTTQVGVGYCAGGACPNGPGTVTFTSQPNDGGFNHNASNSAFDAVRGSASASANPGSGFFAMPELHAQVSGKPGSGGAFSWNYAFAQGVQGYTWNGASTDLAISDFVGTVDFTNNSAPGGGNVSASFAILSSELTQNSIGAQWYQLDNHNIGGFAADCHTDAALGLAQTGRNSATGRRSISTLAIPSTCGRACLCSGPATGKRTPRTPSSSACRRTWRRRRCRCSATTSR